ncbi:hypothetical protein [Ancylobacter lacus]|uniref:hypothetical protein n=1 Tax=Ancylobacter lacus TaxID=2579970 RepID=UPI001BCF46F4|nr:hypothetical protein [Ancylobacter lacus]MBS7539546.1 hypothetical protein [Ancylobacter lacus]
MGAMRRVWAGVAVAAAVLLAGAGVRPARADGATLTQGDVYTDAVGSVVEVSVRNTGTGTIASAVVTCAFTTAGKPAGSAGTTIYNVVSGTKGTDQIHLIGVRADKAACSLGAVSTAN